jgi:hypothetical protein
MFNGNLLMETASREMTIRSNGQLTVFWDYRIMSLCSFSCSYMFPLALSQVTHVSYYFMSRSCIVVDVLCWLSAVTGVMCVE